MNKETKVPSWVAVVVIGIVSAPIIYYGSIAMFPQDEGPVEFPIRSEERHVEEVNAEECFTEVKVAGRVPGYKQCGRGTNITPPIRLNAGMATLAVAAKRTSDFATMFLANVVDSNGAAVPGGYNSVMLREKSTGSATWIMEVRQAGEYSVQLECSSCQWVFGIVQ